MSAATSGNSTKRLILVTGAGRSGTSTIAGVFARLGFHVPLPVLQANESNPRGFYESWWPVKFHNRLTRRAGIELTDGQPNAGQLVTDALDEKARANLRTWLSEQLGDQDLVMVKDPRAAWVPALWSETAHELGASIGYVTMIRHPSEVVGSRSTYYGTRRPGLSERQFDIRNLCGWINQNLTLERETRSQDRVFVTYTGLLTDWRSSLEQIFDALSLPASLLTPTAAAEIDAFIEPSLRRHGRDWGDRDLPPALVELAEQTWVALEACAKTAGTTPDTATLDSTATPDSTAEFDRISASYEQLYGDAAAIAQDYAATRARLALKRGRREGRREAQQASAERRVSRRIRRQVGGVLSAAKSRLSAARGRLAKG